MNIIKGGWRSKVLMECGEQVPDDIVVSIIADTCASPPRPDPPRLLPAPPLFRPHLRQDLIRVFANAWTDPHPIRSTAWAHPAHGCTGKGVAAAD